MSKPSKIAYIYNRYRQQLLYILFGLLTTAVSILVYALLVELFALDELIANVISWLVAVMFAFVTNRIWVFRADKDKSKSFVRQMLAFYSGRVATLLIEEIILWIFIKQLAFNGFAVKCAAQIAVIVLNYVISKLFVFKQNN